MLDKLIQRTVSLLLVICLCAGLVPAAVLAESMPNPDLQTAEPVNDAEIADYGDDSFIIQYDRTVALQSWQSDTVSVLPIEHAKSIAVSGDTLIALVGDETKTSLVAYDIASGAQKMLAELPAHAGQFALCDGMVYYLADGKICRAAVNGGQEEVVYDGSHVRTFYLYEKEIVAFDDGSIKPENEESVAPDFDPYQLLMLKTGEIVEKGAYEDKLYETQRVIDVGYHVTVGNETMPFAEWPNGSHCPDGGNSGTYYDIHGKSVRVPGWECYGFAEMAFYRLFGHFSFSGNGSVARSPKAYRAVGRVPGSNISVNYLKSILGDEVLPGAHIRTGSNGQHSMVYMGREGDYVYTYEGNMMGRSDHNRISVIRRTWSELVRMLTRESDGICFIAMPSVYPNQNLEPRAEAPSIVQESYAGGKKIQLTAPGGADIYFTTDGSIPSTHGQKYTGEFRITTTGTTTIKAIAVRQGYRVSDVSSAVVNVSRLSPVTILSSMGATGLQITMKHDDPNVTIFYTTDGSDPTINSEVYRGVFEIKTGMKIRAIAAKTGCVTSAVAEAVLTPAAPGKPSANLLDTPARIPVGGTAKVQWSKDENATSYKITLKREGKVVETQETTETLATFLLAEAGKYEITVQAVNFVGPSEDSYPPLTVDAMAPCTVTFKDWDETVLARVEVPYGGSPEMPKTPGRAGHDFAGWSVTKDTPIYENTVVHAQYTVRTYTVRFYDTDGKNLLDTQRVDYGKNPTMPDRSVLNIPHGFQFAGWSIKPESTGTSYNPVDGDVDVVAAMAWSEPSLPVDVVINQAIRTKDGNSYKIVVDLSSADDRVKQGRLIAVLKTENGKAVASQIADFQMEMKDPFNTYHQEMTINYFGKAKRVEVIAVGMDTHGNTGGAYSGIATAGVTSETEWGNWSEWTETKPQSGPNIQIHQKTQMRQRALEVTTSSDANLSGWTKYDEEKHETGWSGWSRTRPSDKDGRTIESRSIPATYKTQYNYSGYYSSGKGGWWHFCPGAGKYIHGINFYYVETGWMDNRVNAKAMSKSQTCGGGLSGCTHNGRITVDHDYRVNGGVYYYENSRQVQTGGGYAEYRYKDTTYTYDYYRYGSWTEWRDEGGVVELGLAADLPARETDLLASQAPVPQIDTERRTLYQSREEKVVGDADIGEEDLSGQEYICKGTLSGLEQVYDGHTALILVYQRTNSDPTAEKLQYVGETTIGAGNSYDFTYRPKSDPTADTGDFIVSLAMEGATRIINVDIEEAPMPVYTVKFMADGQEIASQQVTQGHTAEVPEAPEKPGYTFVGWNDYTTSVQSDLTITAKYIRNQYVCAVVDFANEDVKLNTYMAGDTLGTLPELQAEGKIFKGWYAMENGQKKPVSADTVVSSNMIIIADWESVRYKVEFMNGDGSVLSTQMVEHGTAAHIPDEIPTSKGMKFAAWSTSANWWEVTQAVQVQPVFQYPKTVEAPVIMNGNKDKVNIIELLKPSKDAKIFYSIKNLDVLAGTQAENAPVDASKIPMGFDAEYDPSKPIEITGDVEIKMISVAPNQNDSEIVTMEIPYQDPMELTPVDQQTYELRAESVAANAGDLIEVPVFLSSTANLTQIGIVVTTDNEQYVRWISESSAAGVMDASEMLAEGEAYFPVKLQIDSSAPAGSYAVSVEASAVNQLGEAVEVRGTTFTVEVAADTSSMLTGSIRSYNPGTPIRIELQQNGYTVNTVELPAENGSGVTTRSFEMKVELPDVYDLVITKDGHLPVVIRNIAVEGGKVELGAHSNPAISTITMVVGDLNGDGFVDKTDRNILWNSANFDLPTSEAVNALADINADGQVNDVDLRILHQDTNYNRSTEDCVFDYAEIQ